jgi:hypothetical protein
MDPSVIPTEDSNLSPDEPSEGPSKSPEELYEGSKRSAVLVESGVLQGSVFGAYLINSSAQ